MADPTTAREVIDGLHSRWPDDKYLFVEEAPQDAARQGRKIDVMAVALWASRGYDIDAVEVKVSMSDWKRELDHPEKAHWWWLHSSRYWIAVPAGLAPKIKDQLPDTWGLLAVSDTACRVAVQAPKHKPEPIPWNSMIGILRAAADAGFNALNRAEERGRQRGVEQGRRENPGERQESRVQARLEEVLETCKVFQEASGIDLAQPHLWRRDAELLGEAARLARLWIDQPSRLDQDATRVLASLERMSAGLVELREGMAALRKP